MINLSWGNYWKMEFCPYLLMFLLLYCFCYFAAIYAAVLLFISLCLYLIFVWSSFFIQWTEQMIELIFFFSFFPKLNWTSCDLTCFAVQLWNPCAGMRKGEEVEISNQKGEGKVYCIFCYLDLWQDYVIIR